MNALGFQVESSVLSSRMAADNRHLAWDHVDKKFQAEQIFGAVGADVIRRGAARSSVHEFGYSLCLQAALLGCVNGAGIAAWPGRPTPLSLVVLVANPQQTRKSQTARVMTEVGKAVDDACRQRAVDLGLSTGSGDLQSLLLSVFTEAAFFQRTSSGWSHHVSGRRLHFSSLVSLDEGYRLLKMLNLTCDAGKKESSSGPSDSASQWNTLLQTGESNLACKAGLSYEAHQSVNVAAVGNVHLGPLTAMLRGELGQHEVAALERILICSSRPVAPHAPLPEAVVLPDNAERLVWVPLLRCMCEDLGLSEDVLKEGAERVRSVTLAAGTETEVRFTEVTEPRSGLRVSPAESSFVASNMAYFNRCN